MIKHLAPRTASGERCCTGDGEYEKSTAPFSPVTASPFNVCAQLHDAKLAAGPGAGQRKHDEREWIPVGPKCRSLIPRNRGTDNAHNKAREAAYQGVQHGPIRREPGRDVAGRNAVDSAIDRGKQEGPFEADHRLAPRGEDTD